MKISKEVYDALVDWRSTVGNWADSDDISKLPDNVKDWWTDPSEGIQSDRLIAIIRFSDYVDTFEIEKPKKWVVRSKELANDGEHIYISVTKLMGINRALNVYDEIYATKFDTKEEAQSWANAHQEVIGVEE